MPRRRRVLLTGSTGFLGRSFLERCADRYDFVAIGRRPPATAEVPWVEADLRRPLPPELPRRIDAVVHLASVRTPSPGHGVEELFALNAGVVAGLLDYARRAGASRFVLGSTGGVCGYHAGRIRESTRPAPFDAYTLSKWQGEMIARHQPHDRGVSVAIVRYFFPYGPGQESGIVNVLARRIRTGEPIVLHRGGRRPRLNPVFVDDACELTRRALDASGPLTVNCAGPEVATVRQIACLIAELHGVQPTFTRATDPRIGDMVASNAGAVRRLDFRPRVGLRDGLTRSLLPA